MSIIVKKSDFKKLYDIACEGWKKKFDDMLKPFQWVDTVDINDSLLPEMQKACTAEQLPVFQKIFSKFLPKESDLFTISSYAEVCKRLKIKQLKLKDFAFLPEDEREKALAQHQIRNIERLFNGKWVKNWLDRSQRKFYPWFDLAASGWVVFVVCDRLFSSNAEVGYYQDEKTARYVGTTFIDIYAVIMDK